MYDKDNDVNRIFLDDSRDKKRTAIGVHSRASRRGYIRGGIRTQSDYLTNKERKKLSGEVRSYNMYEQYKDLKNCNLTEILSKDATEIKAILAVIKENNTCSKICAVFKVSNGKLYSIYNKYGVYTEKRARVRTEELKNVISKEKFGLMDSINKGKYIVRITENSKLTLGSLAKHWDTSRSTLKHYANKVTKNVPKDIEVKNQVALEILEPKEEANIYIEKEEQLHNKVLELETENKQLLECIAALSKETNKEKFQGFKLDMNGEYSKEDLCNRLLSLDNITIEATRYKLELHLEEVR